jgi:hypothetical protein
VIGGTVSYFEWVQDRGGNFWNEETVKRDHEARGRRGHGPGRTSQRNLRTACPMLAIDRAVVHRCPDMYDRRVCPPAKRVLAFGPPDGFLAAGTVGPSAARLRCAENGRRRQHDLENSMDCDETLGAW